MLVNILAWHWCLFLGMYCSERSWNMTFDLRRTVFSKLARRRKCNCSFDSSKCASKESWGVGVEHISRSKRANSCTFFLSALKTLAFALINSSKWIFLWENLFLYWQTSWSWPTKNIYFSTGITQKKRDVLWMCFLSCWSGTVPPFHDIFKVLHINDLYRCCCNLCVKEYL